MTHYWNFVGARSHISIQGQIHCTMWCMDLAGLALDDSGFKTSLGIHPYSWRLQTTCSMVVSLQYTWSGDNALKYPAIVVTRSRTFEIRLPSTWNEYYKAGLDVTSAWATVRYHFVTSVTILLTFQYELLWGKGGGSKSPILGIIVNLTCWHSRGKESAPRYGASRYICPHAKLWFILPWGSTVQKRLAGLINRMSHSHTSCPSTMTMRLAETLCGDPDRSAENHISEVWADRHRNFDVN